MASYPSAVKTFTAKNAGDTIQPSHIGDLQDEVSAIEDGLLNGTAPVNSSRITAPSAQITNSTVSSLTAGTLVVSGIATGAAMPSLRAYSTSVTGQSSNSQVAVSFTASAFNVGGLHSTSTNPDRVTIPTGSSGVYWVAGAINLLTLNSAISLHLSKNSSVEISSYDTTPAGAARTVHVVGLMQCNAGDILRLEVQNGAASTVSYGSTSATLGNRLQVQKVW